MNCGPLTPEFTVMVWWPFMHQMREIVKTSSILGNCFRQPMAGTAEWFVPNSHGRRVSSFVGWVWMSRSPGTKNMLCTQNTPRCEWNGTPASQITSRKQKVLQFDCGTGVSLLGCVHRAWWSTAGLWHTFLVWECSAGKFNVLQAALFMVALCNRADHYIFALWFLSIFFLFFPRLISAAIGWMYTIHWHTVWP